MTDIELLGMAAKAAGYSLGPDWDLMEDGILVNGTGYGDGFMWCPLTDDGDALRLAVKLDLHVAIECQSAGAVTIEWDFNSGGEPAGTVSQVAPEGGDDYAATRRAIVHAAAEIGKAL